MCVVKAFTNVVHRGRVRCVGSLFLWWVCFCRRSSWPKGSSAICLSVCGGSMDPRSPAALLSTTISPWWLPAKHRAFPSVDKVVTLACAAARDVFVAVHNESSASNSSSSPPEKTATPASTSQASSTALCRNLGQRFKTCLRPLQPLVTSFYSRDAVVASQCFGELLGYLVELFAEHVVLLTTVVKRGGSAVAASVVDLDIDAALLHSMPSPAGSSIELNQSQGANDRRAQLALVRDVYDFLKHSSMFCWLFLRSTAFTKIAVAQQQSFIKATMDHLQVCLAQRHVLAARAKSDLSMAARARAVTGVISFNLAMLSCLLQLNSPAVLLVRKHDSYIDITREVRMWGVCASPATDPYSLQRFRHVFSSQTQFRLANTCFTVARNTLLTLVVSSVCVYS